MFKQHRTRLADSLLALNLQPWEYMALVISLATIVSYL